MLGWDSVRDTHKTRDRQIQNLACGFDPADLVALTLVLPSLFL